MRLLRRLDVCGGEGGEGEVGVVGGAVVGDCLREGEDLDAVLVVQEVGEAGEREGGGCGVAEDGGEGWAVGGGGRRRGWARGG